MINVNEVLERLEKMEGKKFDEDNIIIAFESDLEVIINKVEGQESHFDGYGVCRCYNAYENTEDSEVFAIYVNKNDEIVSVK